MANTRFSFLSLLILSLSLHITVSADSPPSPSPQSPAGSPSPSLSPSAYAPSPAPAPYSPLDSSPPAPSPLNPSPGSSPAPSPGDEAAFNRTGVDEREDEQSSGGMSGSKKAGIAIGIIVAASVLMLAGMVYKKRQENLRRAQYNYGVRRDIIL